MSKKYNFDMSVVSGTYAGELALPYVTAAITGAETLKNNRARLMEGVVAKAVINNVGFNQQGAGATVIQASVCAGTDGGNTQLTEQIVELDDLMVKELICRKTIFPTFMAAQGRMRRDGNIPADFAQFLLASTAAQAANDVESLIWTGASPLTTGLLSDDGTFDITGVRASQMGGFAEADLDAIGAFTKATILNAMNAVFEQASASPGILLQPGAGFYLSYEAFAFFQQAIAAQSTTEGYNQQLLAPTYLGYPVYPTAGIPNTADIIAFTYPDNIVVATNAYTGNEAASLIPVYQYDGSDHVKVTMDFAIGVNVAVPGDGVVGFDFTA